MLFGVERGITAEDVAEGADKLYEIGAGEDPAVEIRDRDKPGGVDMGVPTFDYHVSSGRNIHAGRVARVGLHEPNDNGDVVENLQVDHGNSALSLEEIHSPTIIVCEHSSLGMEAGVFLNDRDKMLSDEPFHVLSIG